MPSDEKDPNSERWCKCLLCNKWCQDETSHTGSLANSQGSKEHLKNLRNYGPGDAWWQLNVAAVRNKWHPVARAQPKAAPQVAPPRPAAPPPAVASAVAPPPPTIPTAGHDRPLPWGWKTAVCPDSRATYFFHATTKQTQWHHPSDAVEAEAEPDTEEVEC
mmetsp:Transcript_76075/g.246967  ORF Transcript_76075/g.246967 Transcript_76075/m.246967 type:complete len:161 (+) Transcript_76075:757-1239(+)